MDSYEKMLEDAKKRLTKYYLEDMRSRLEQAEKHGGKVTPYPAIPRRERIAFSEITKLATEWGVKVELPEPSEINGVGYDVEIPVLSCTEEYDDVMPVLRPKKEPEAPKKWYQRWFSKKKKPEKKNGCGLVDNLTFDEVLEQIDSRKVKHGLNAQLRQAEVGGERFKLTRRQRAAEWVIRKKNAVRHGLSVLWNAIRRG